MRRPRPGPYNVPASMLSRHVSLFLSRWSFPLASWLDVPAGATTLSLLFRLVYLVRLSPIRIPFLDRWKLSTIAKVHHYGCTWFSWSLVSFSPSSLSAFLRVTRWTKHPLHTALEGTNDKPKDNTSERYPRKTDAAETRLPDWTTRTRDSFAVPCAFQLTRCLPASCLPACLLACFLACSPAPNTVPTIRAPSPL